MFKPFSHLHVRSDYSLLSGAVTLKKLIKRCDDMGMPAVALTDVGNLFGAVQFYSLAIARGIKPILGCELFIVDSLHDQPVKAKDYASIVLLARSNKGWKHLMRLVSMANLQEPEGVAVISKQDLARYSEGLIGLSCGRRGEIDRALLAGNRRQAEALLLAYVSLFSPSCFYLELQRHGRNDEERIEQDLIDMARKHDVHLLASNDVHFMDTDEYEPMQAMQALRDGKLLADLLGDDSSINEDYYFKSYEEMLALFEDIPEAIENTLHIANRCNVDLQFGQYQLPNFVPPNDVSLEKYMRLQSHKGLDDHWSLICLGCPEAKREAYDQRLDYELDIIESMGFPGYFLIVADFIAWARQHDIPVGPGRGSGAGSLVAYSLGITDLDPLRYGLLFERFLNPERVSMPDFDIDFCMDRRDEVIQYVTQHYGADHVSQIITFGTMKAKAVIRDVGRVLGMPFPKVDEIAKLIPNDLNISLKKAQIDEPRLLAMQEESSELRTLFQIAEKLEGNHRHAGKHAAGVIISRLPLIDTAPLCHEAGEGGTVVQWDMGNAEKMGLIKFDFLGLKTLTVLHQAVHWVRYLHAQDELKDFSLEGLPLDDAATYDLLQRGDTAAVFQLESSGMRELLTRIKPDCFEDIIALVALYRPGPLGSGMVDDFIERKHGLQTVVYAVPALEPILSETYGVILYQEQVMKIAQVLSGYSLGQADMLRRAMGKKKPEEMAKQRDMFLSGAAKNKIPVDKAEYIFDLMEKFAGYGFNKSHSAAYALIAYQTAYLKAHEPQAFMAAVMSCDMGKSEKIAALVEDCKHLNVAILPPHVNHSSWSFTPEADAIRFGLGAVKSVGEKAVEELCAARAEQPFTSLDDVLARLPGQSMNKRMIEALLKAGAFDGLVPHCRVALEALPQVMALAQRKRKERLSMQASLFSDDDENKEETLYPVCSPWGKGELLDMEHEVLGLYLTGHPLEVWTRRLRGLVSLNLADVKSMADGMVVVVAVGISAVRLHRGKRGLMAFVRVEDLHASMEMVCFSKVYETVREQLVEGQAVLVSARLDRSRDEPNLLLASVLGLQSGLETLVKRIAIHSGVRLWDAALLEKCRALFAQYPGEVVLSFHVKRIDGSIASLAMNQTVSWCLAFDLALRNLFGEEHVFLHCASWSPPVEERKEYGNVSGV